MPGDAEDRLRAETLGAYLKSVRGGIGLSLRDVEEASGKEVSNAYLSQLENGKILKPSPNILHRLAAIYGVSYPKLMERAGYVFSSKGRSEGAHHGRAATYSVSNLTADEERELLKYLGYVRSLKRKS